MNSPKETIIKNCQEIDSFKEKFYKTNRIGIQFNTKKEENLHIKNKPRQASRVKLQLT